jgi:hypothetical protein
MNQRTAKRLAGFKSRDGRELSARGFRALKKLYKSSNPDEKKLILERCENPQAANSRTEQPGE